MIVNVNGTIEAISQPRKFTTNGRQGYSVSVVMKHDFRSTKPASTNPNTYLGYITFDVISTQDRPLWKQMNLKVGEDVEVSLNVDVQISTNQNETRWFNRITAFACERDKRRWHTTQEVRQAGGFPGNTQQPAQPVQQQPAVQAPAPAPAPQTVAPWGTGDDEIPF